MGSVRANANLGYHAGVALDPNRPFPWLDRAAYPFRSRWLELPDGPLHYVDEGEGETLLLVHGTPQGPFDAPMPDGPVAAFAPYQGQAQIVVYGHVHRAFVHATVKLR